MVSIPDAAEKQERVHAGCELLYVPVIGAEA
jgi:hypothetical protein